MTKKRVAQSILNLVERLQRLGLLPNYSWDEYHELCRDLTRIDVVRQYLGKKEYIGTGVIPSYLLEDAVDPRKTFLDRKEEIIRNALPPWYVWLVYTAKGARLP